MLDRYKVFVFDECHKLSIGAQNILLIFIEDYTEGNYFIFCSTEPNKNIPTLQNRCVPIEFNKVDLESMRRLLFDVCEIEKIEISFDVLAKIIGESDGKVRNALNSLQKAVLSRELKEKALH